MALFVRSSTRLATTFSRRCYASLSLEDPDLVLSNINGEEIDGEHMFKDKKVVLFGVPGAFTPICTTKHFPSFLDNAEELKKKGVDMVGCVSVNDRFVMKAWGDHMKVDGEVEMFADANASFVKSLGLDVDLPPLGGVRSKRFVLLVDDGKVVLKNVEKSPGDFEVTSADVVLEKLSAKE